MVGSESTVEIELEWRLLGLFLNRRHLKNKVHNLKTVYGFHVSHSRQGKQQNKNRIWKRDFPLNIETRTATSSGHLDVITCHYTTGVFSLSLSFSVSHSHTRTHTVTLREPPPPWNPRWKTRTCSSLRDRSTRLMLVIDCDHSKAACACCHLFMGCLKTWKSFKKGFQLVKNQ